jgi:L-threonine kinase
MESVPEMYRYSVTVRVPATCGELIQGPYLEKESLVSLPIDRYTVVEASRNPYAGPFEAQNLHGQGGRLLPPGAAHLQPKAAEAFHLAVSHLSLTPEKLAGISIRLHSELACGKGYATSTSDLYGVIAALFELFEHPATPDLYASLCASIEPTDGLMFHDWVLFDHLNGVSLKSYPALEGIQLLILEPEKTCLTDTLRSRQHFTEALSGKTTAPFEAFERAAAERDVRGIFEASTLSAFENQSTVYKPYLEQVVMLSKQFDAYGVAAAHSGTLLGIALPDHTDQAALLHSLDEHGILAYYTNHFTARTISGGHHIIPGGHQCL